SSPARTTATRWWGTSCPPRWAALPRSTPTTAPARASSTKNGTALPSSSTRKRTAAPRRRSSFSTASWPMRKKQRRRADKHRDRYMQTGLGLGPWLSVVGAAPECDYSGTQACRALQAGGIRTVLRNSNPATLMTDPDVADLVYIEPMTLEVVERILDIEKPD